MGVVWPCGQGYAEAASAFILHFCRRCPAPSAAASPAWAALPRPPSGRPMRPLPPPGAGSGVGMTARQDGVLSADKDGSDAAPTAAKRRLDSVSARFPAAAPPMLPGTPQVRRTLVTSGPAHGEHDLVGAPLPAQGWRLLPEGQLGGCRRPRVSKR